ncbi:IreB family regulatory phosphoprotein [Wukongibacter baidiensis]|uniref:IreB family regulatory phosphoprotein n=1 Tax=Wukongibacter baidiensis TaxID=1723361 RepID=UPI003D7FD094
MSDKFDNFTMRYNVETDIDSEVKNILTSVYSSLKEKGYNPVNQIVGYLLSGDPTYITSHNNARNVIRKLERDELIEELLKKYLEDEIEID